MAVRQEALNYLDTVRGYLQVDLLWYARAHILAETEDDAEVANAILAIKALGPEHIEALRTYLPQLRKRIPPVADTLSAAMGRVIFEFVQITDQEKWETYANRVLKQTLTKFPITLENPSALCLRVQDLLNAAIKRNGDLLTDVFTRQQQTVNSIREERKRFLRNVEVAFADAVAEHAKKVAADVFQTVLQEEETE